MLEFTDVCLITDNVPALSSFYEKLFNVTAQGDEIHSFIAVPGLGIAIYNKTAATNDNPKLNYESSGNDCFYIGFNCDDAVLEYERIKALNICKPTEPKVWPWGAKSFYFKDIDGNMIVVRSWPKEG